jgi:hypothetical protein
MKKFNVKFQREFEVQVEADSLEIAGQLARQVLAQFPAGSCKLLSIYAEDYVEPTESIGPDQPTPPRGGSPLGGGSPGTPTATVPVLVDQIAEAA